MLGKRRPGVGPMECQSPLPFKLPLSPARSRRVSAGVLQVPGWLVWPGLRLPGAGRAGLAKGTLACMLGAWRTLMHSRGPHRCGRQAMQRLNTTSTPPSKPLAPSPHKCRHGEFHPALDQTVCPHPCRTRTRARGPRLRPHLGGWLHRLLQPHAAVQGREVGAGLAASHAARVGHLIWAGLPCSALTVRACPDMHGLQSRVSICKDRALSDLAPDFGLGFLSHLPCSPHGDILGRGSLHHLQSPSPHCRDHCVTRTFSDDNSTVEAVRVYQLEMGLHEMMLQSSHRT